MTGHDRHAALLVIVALLIAAAVSTCTGRPARAHGSYHDWLGPDGKRCCSDLERECRPVRSYKGDDGFHYVFLSGRWQQVPPDKVLARDSPDGSSHVCASYDDRIYCFVAGKPKG